ncbi:Signal peptide peptidase 1 [Tetrabaena socialis]|uniref:Signal peptide peptidase 1 n=1 Tax=Tetrabaena socialis TaxID=47790 RepID=A0A2J7ZXX7_9CHLO|nr:Signal peptide peptidase 1 [Tetrabaena socialis]|eukprot:PNH05115.1 Signal peptide peptidase 1 [Tetrabaena socialis]
MATSVTSHASLYASNKPALTAHLLLIGLSLAPLVITVPTNFNIIATAALAVYAGSWRSVKPAPPTESMTKKDAMRFPLVGSCVLFGLFLLFKFVPKWLVNALLSLYLGGIAVFVLTSATVPYVLDFFPEGMRHLEVAFPRFKIPHILDNSDGSMHPTVPELVCAAVSLGFCVWYYAKKHWFANNTLGLAFCLEGIEHLSLGSVQVGVILLVGLFFYDIFWVFCTPVMVSVAKNFDGPIKLLFPRAGTMADGKRAFAMLGLGDIVIPAGGPEPHAGACRPRRSNRPRAPPPPAGSGGRAATPLSPSA